MMVSFCRHFSCTFFYPTVIVLLEYFNPMIYSCLVFALLLLGCVIEFGPGQMHPTLDYKIGGSHLDCSL